MFHVTYLESLCARRSWPTPVYSIKHHRDGTYSAVARVHSREYTSNGCYPTPELARDSAACTAYVVCRDFSMNDGFMASSSSSSTDHHHPHHHHHHSHHHTGSHRHEHGSTPVLQGQPVAIGTGRHRNRNSGSSGSPSPVTTSAYPSSRRSRSSRTSHTISDSGSSDRRSSSGSSNSPFTTKRSSASYATVDRCYCGADVYGHFDRCINCLWRERSTHCR